MSYGASAVATNIGATGSAVVVNKFSALGGNGVAFHTNSDGTGWYYIIIGY